MRRETYAISVHPLRILQRNFTGKNTSVYLHVIAKLNLAIYLSFFHKNYTTHGFVNSAYAHETTRVRLKTHGVENRRRFSESKIGTDFRNVCHAKTTQIFDSRNSTPTFDPVCLQPYKLKLNYLPSFRHKIVQQIAGHGVRI